MNFEQIMIAELPFVNSPYKHDTTPEHSDMLNKRDFIWPKTSISWICAITQIMIFFFFYGATTLIVLAFSTISFHLRRSCTCSAHFISLIFFWSFLTSSFHRDLGLPAGLPCEWFPFVCCFYYASFVHSIYVSKPTQSLGFNIIYYVPVFN